MKAVPIRTFAAAVAISLTVPLLGATPAVAADDHLVLQYSFDETSGTVAADSSGNAHNGSFVGSPTLGGGDTGVTLDGVDDHVKLPDNILAGLDSITVSTEVLIRSNQPSPYFIYGLGTAATSNSGAGYLFATGNKYKTAITPTYWNGEQVADSGADLARGVWKTLTYTLDDATDVATLYLDGVKVAGKTGVTTKPSAIGAGTTSANFIGRSNYAADKYLAGSVRDFRIYNTALSATDVAALQPADAQLVTRDADHLTLGDLSAVESNLTLPTSGPNGSTITWASDTPATISTTGVVTRPAAASGPATVTLTATVMRGTASETRTFPATVTPLRDDQGDVDAAAAALAIATLDDVRGNLTLPAAPAGIGLSWTSSDPGVVAIDGVVTRPSATKDVTLTAHLTKGGATATRAFTASVRQAAELGDYEGYAFAYFTGNSLEGENIYLAASEGNNALDWNELNNGQPVLRSTEGTKGLRDPFIIRSPEGDTFYLIATDLSIGSGTSWGDSVRTGSQYLEVWESHDLVNWTDQRHVKVAPDNAGNTWAPEAYYDDTIGAYVVFWASSLYADTDPGHTGSSYHRMMYVTTRDFVSFSTPEVWQDQGVSRIDSTVLKADDVYYRFTKDEGAGGTGCTDIIQESSTELRATLESWTQVDSCIGKKANTSAVEGPTAFQANPGDVNGDKTYLFVDEYGGRGYIPLQTDDIAHPDWKVAPKYDLPASPRHGTVIPVTAAELETLTEELGQGPAPVPANEDGEILRYTFENGSGTRLSDVSGNGQDGTIVGGATWSDSALQLNGSTGYVDLPDNILSGVTDVSIEADVWIDPAQANPYFIYGLGNTVNKAGNGYLFSTGNAYRTSLATGNWSTEQTVSQGSNLARGTWAHLTYVLQGTTATLYLDGVAVKTGTVTADPGDIGGGITTANYLGRSNYDTDNTFRGKFREFAIYNRALSSAEVLAASGNSTALAGVTLAESDVLKLDPIVNQAAHEVVFPVKPGTDLSALTPVFATSAAIVAAPASGTTVDLRTPVTVTLTGAGSSVTWTLRAVEMASPSIPGLYADPNVVAFGDTYYIYATADGYAGWGGKDFYVWSSQDLVSWERSDKPILTLDGASGTVPWATGNAWAPTITEKDGKFYFYFSGHNATYDRKTIGVAVADSPEGPFTADPTAMILNNEAVTSGQAIDPAAFVDPVSRKHYLFWGNGSPVYAELADDMRSIKPATLKKISGLTDFREGAFLNYRDGMYHLTYSIDDTGSENYRVGYATATSVDGPWTYRGVILQKDTTQGILATGHNSVLNVPGTDDWYIVYHRFAMPGGDGQHRETTIDRLTFNPVTGLINPVTPTLTSVPAQRIEDAQPLATRIEGIAKVGETLTAVVDVPWTATGYVWTRDGDPVDGATEASYLLTSADLGSTIAVRVTADKPLWSSADAEAGTGPVQAADAVIDPVVTAAVEGAAANAAGWYSGAVTVALTLNDGAAGDIEYRLDGGTWTSYATPIALAADGDHLVEHRVSVDGTPVDVSLGSLTVRIDATAPVSTVTLDPADGVGTPAKPVHLALAATDGTSGVGELQYRFGDAAWAALPADGLTFAEVGATVVSYRAVDRAGTVEAHRTVVVVVTGPATDPGTNPGTDPGTNPGTNPGTGPGTGPGTTPGTDPGTGAGPGTLPGTGPGTPPGTGPGTGSGAGTASTLTLTSSVLEAGGTVTVSGSGFTPGERVEFTLFSTPRYLGGVQSDAAGSFTATLSIPAGVEPGSHTLRAVGATSGTIATFAVTVKAAGNGAPLAATGADAGWPASLALLLLAAGTLLLLVRRGVVRRRRPASTRG
ncbi:family 43 glycosylhydrolase [Cryobacterium arcticum]|uniref:Beta-xylosidase n=1 Tax=Cryobacterium arcticum TaxID=670052 RepID=A0A1B1BFM6_9MICO|nr:family 43 glycosylhydrolase [Cryobacterium arcticum]ANP71333.1 beta-xylosidase [Cryobacterium arcticum]